MKKGVIMDIRGRKAVVLTPDGEFTTINLKRNHTLTIGSEIKLAPKPIKQKKGYFTPSMPTLAGMTALLLLVVLVTGVIPVTQNDAVAAYISFDINPSIEVGVNSDLEVVQYQAWNSDGEGLNLSKETKNMPLSDFAGLLVSRLDKDGYLSNGGKLLIVASDVEKQERSENIKAALEKAIRNIEQNESLKNQSIAITTVLNSDYSTRQEAVKKGVSPGKYVTYLSALDRGVSITLSDVRNLSVKKIEAMDSQNMTADESDSLDPIKESSDLEDSVIQLNDKKAPSTDETTDNELILQESNESDLEDNQDNSKETIPEIEDEEPTINKESVKLEEEKTDNNNPSEIENTEKKTKNQVKKAEKKNDKQNEKNDRKHQKEDVKDKKDYKKDMEKKVNKKQEKKEDKKEKKQEKNKHKKEHDSKKDEKDK
ncbi:anti-sigma factor domain-containing protein [Pseudalkalibacillus hwajinpoensis]|uniref:Anti-sigma factor domain-containing protein n=1 Tax=Guptibacillus hwajinpoensis TaxID=208199 RepID=A0A4V5PYA3_9BACL|nr:anti-sigma factor domain-containing protein [Pseudalkalibacillus hwajinpoensis]TKD69338.1 anti-sigma factor domain-containing protein [Pseudalkalibacillus hwajinpoensis]